MIGVSGADELQCFMNSRRRDLNMNDEMSISATSEPRNTTELGL
jgi:hypothetical protein